MHQPASSIAQQASCHHNHSPLTRERLCTNGSRIRFAPLTASSAAATVAWRSYDPQPQQCTATSVVVPCSGSRCTVIAAAASNGAGGASRTDAIWDHVVKMADKYLGAGSPLTGSNGKRSRNSSLQPPMQAIHILLGAYVVVWVLTSVQITSSGPLLPAKLLSLDQISTSSNWCMKLLLPLTDAFLSSSSSGTGGLLLARNLFFGYMFGRVVENTEGSTALCWVFVASAVGGAATSLALLPRRAVLQGCAATAAMFGLFSAATIFNRHKSWHWQRVFELAVLSPFVMQQLLLGSWHSYTHCCSIMGFGVPSTWVPLLGGFAGAATAAGVLAVTRAVQSSITQQQQQQLQKKADGDSDSGDPGLSALLARAVAQVLRKSMGL